MMTKKVWIYNHKMSLRINPWVFLLTQSQKPIARRMSPRMNRSLLQIDLPAVIKGRREYTLPGLIYEVLSYYESILPILSI